MSLLLEPFSYGYMTNAMWVSALVGAVCAFLSAYLMLKGWSLIGDALSHSIVPGVAGGISCLFHPLMLYRYETVAPDEAPTHTPTLSK